MRLRARPWRPIWLANVSEKGVDAASGETHRRGVSPVAGEPFLRRFGRETYRSAGQRAAIRSALSTPPGGALVVCLPTGEGKSFIFHCIAECGFGDATEGETSVTLVVTPTVALAQDHEFAARELGFEDKPRAYIGGNSMTNATIRDRIADGTQGLVFASPEAVCGPLRRSLIAASERGQLRALVVDEAHLIDAWGAEFRPEFQVLSGVRRELVAATGGRLRTFLLSATYTEAAMRTLRAFFSDESTNRAYPQFAAVSAARLRPEPCYWVAPVSGEWERQERTCEALFRLPRPLILYTTRVDDALRWHQRLQAEGFSRLTSVTGETSAVERNQAVRGWRDGTLDVVVATSAFGLGIDNPHVRSVVHACIPETLDRFYQEVGRGGRDGAESISLLLPAIDDFAMAKSLSQHRIITVDVGLPRWRSVFLNGDRLEHGNNEYTVRLDLPPGADARQIDMTSRENTEWNQRTLALMVGAGLIELIGPVTSTPRYGRDVEVTEDLTALQHAYQTVRVHPGHAEREVWLQHVEARRRAILDADLASLRIMQGFIHNPERQCMADVLAPLYEVGATGYLPGLSVGRACGGCAYCRAANRQPYERPVAEPLSPWPASSRVQPPVDRELDSSGRLLVFMHGDELESRRAIRRFVSLLALLIRSGFRNLVVLDGFSLDYDALLKETGPTPWFLAEQWVRHRLPPGHTLILTTPQTRLTASMWTPPNDGEARMVVVPGEVRDPALPDSHLRQRHSGRSIDLTELIERLAQ